MVSDRLSNLSPACNDLGLALPMLAKATWGIRLPHRDYIGQRASPCSDMFVQFISEAHSLFIPWLIKYKEACEDNPGCKIRASI